MTDYRANYALVSFQEHLGPDEDGLDVPWASHSGDKTDQHTFDVPTGDPQDAYVQMQVYDVGTYDHDVVVNDKPLSGSTYPRARAGSSGWTPSLRPG